MLGELEVQRRQRRSGQTLNAQLKDAVLRHGVFAAVNAQLGGPGASEVSAPGARGQRWCASTGTGRSHLWVVVVVAGAGARAELVGELHMHGDSCRTAPSLPALHATLALVDSPCSWPASLGCCALSRANFFCP